MPPQRNSGSGRKWFSDDPGDTQATQEPSYWDLPVEAEERVEEAGEDSELRPAPPRQPPPKRRRTSPSPSGRMEGLAEPSVRITGVPVEYTYDMLVELHDSFGFAVESVKHMDFEPFERGGRQGPAVRVVTVIYADEDTAAGAAATLHNQPVANRAGETLYLKAKLLERGGRRNSAAGYGRYVGPRSGGDGVRQREDQRSQRRGGWGSGWSGSSWGSGAWGGGGWGGKRKGPDVLYPSVYISDVPIEYKEATMLKLHEACSLDSSKVMAVKFLPPQEVLSETCCCIVRYQDQEAADAAVSAIRGRPVQLRSGACKFFGAKIAKPAKWMLERGVASQGGEQSALPDAKPPAVVDTKAKDPPAAKKELDWCGQGPKCLGKVGMLLYEDLSTGMPFCEACWSRFELEDAEAAASAEAAAALGASTDGRGGW